MRNSADYWPYREFGPSNWEKRPERLVPDTIVTDTDDGRQYVRMKIWNAMNLAAMHSANALENGEYSPDALCGLLQYIRKLRLREFPEGSIDTEKILELESRFIPLLIWGLRRADFVPKSYLQKFGHPSITEQGITGVQLIEMFVKWDFMFLPITGYVWENTERLLCVTARFLDEKNRSVTPAIRQKTREVDGTLRN